MSGENINNAGENQNQKGAEDRYVPYLINLISLF